MEKMKCLQSEDLNEIKNEITANRENQSKILHQAADFLQARIVIFFACCKKRGKPTFCKA
jgi:hypothetical protein